MRPTCRRIALGLWIAVASLNASRLASAQEGYSEYSVKAAFLFNFLKFTRFPEPAGSDLILCIAVPDDIVRHFQSLNGKTLDNRILHVLPVTPLQFDYRCSVVFVARGYTEAAREQLSTVRRGVLTIGESPAFLGSGGIINFFVEDGKVRFEIDLEHARAAQIELSSKLLQLGKVIGRKNP